MVPFILQNASANRVILCTTGVNAALLGSYFPQLEQSEIVSYGIRYSRRIPQWLNILLQLPAVLSKIRTEKKQCRELVEKYGADVVVSDNRYGFYSGRAHSIFVSHQLNPAQPLPGTAIALLQARYLRRFDEILVPDYAEPAKRLTGRLSEQVTALPPVKFIGPQSALRGNIASSNEPLYDVLLLLSGPEPQRTELERILVSRLRPSSGRIAMVRGTGVKMKERPPGWKVYDLCSGETLAAIIHASEKVISRSGYSTLMDLHLLGKKSLILVPTPGQPEQEYLASHWEKCFGARVIRQKELKRARLY